MVFVELLSKDLGLAYLTVWLLTKLLHKSVSRWEKSIFWKTPLDSLHILEKETGNNHEAKL